MEIESEVFGEDNALESELVGLSNDEIRQRIRAFDNEVRIMKSDMNRIKHEAKEQMSHVKDNKEKVKMNKVVSPYPKTFHVSLTFSIPSMSISQFCAVCSVPIVFFHQFDFHNINLS